MASRRKDAAVGLRSLRAPVIAAVLLTVVALIGLGVAWEWLLKRTSERSAVQDSGRYGVDIGRAALEPFITDDLLAGKQDAVNMLAIAGTALIHEGAAMHVELWSIAEKVLWSDRTELIGRTFQLEVEEGALFASHGALAELRHDGLGPDSAGASRLQVDFGSQTASGVPVLVEIDYPITLVESRAARDRGRFRPLLLIGLGVLIAAQVPIFRALRQRRKSLEAQRRQLVERFIATGDVERRRIASAVHDGAVQDLIGVTLGLSVAADEVGSPMKEHLSAIADTTRRTVHNLRSLLTNIYPVEVPEAGWVYGLDDIINALRQRGVVVNVDVAHIPLPPAEAVLMLRVGREALRNVAAHAEASRVDIVMSHDDTATSLRITDNGVGFDHDTAEHQLHVGHLGLQLLHDLAADMGATLVVDSALGRGTTVTLKAGGVV